MGNETGIDAVVLVDDDRRFVHANEAACSLLGCSLGQLTDLRVEDITDPSLRHTIDRAWFDFLARGTLTGEFRVRRLDGVIVPVQFSAMANFPVPRYHLSRLRPL